MRISSVQAFAETSPDNVMGARSWLSQTRIANPMSIYPAYAANRSTWNGPPQKPLVVQVTTNEGVVGWGRGAGGQAGVEIITGHFAKLLLGEDPFDIERLWDVMWRSSLPYGRKGLAIHALSGIDIALWDLIGKARGEPVWRLLGGLTKDRAPIYCTGNDVDLALRHGVRSVKLAMPYGPSDGRSGTMGNIDLVAETRERLGPEGEIMLDCYMAWNVPYSLRMAEEIAPYRVKWMEECLPPDDYDGYAELRRKVQGTMIATGEHEYTRWGHLELLRRKAVDILQPDVHWCGGITEMKRIADLASAFNVTVVPHGGGLSAEAQAVVFPSVNCPLLEYFVSREPDAPAPPEPFEGRIDAVNGFIKPWLGSGLGLTLNPDAFKQTYGCVPPS